MNNHPDELSDRRFSFDADVVAALTTAEAAISRFDATADTLTSTEALARLLLRAESVASSHIEGLVVGGRRLLRAEAARELGLTPDDPTATEVLGNIDAMSWAVEGMSQEPEITVDGLTEMHRRLLANTPLVEHAGRIRTEQNWIGGSSYNPCSAVFVPPPPDHVDRLLDDLCRFVNGDDLPAVAQAAIAHAQFETIHPFVDGNGRTGRTLIHVVLRRRGLTRRVLLPVSLILATWSEQYVAGLTATRYRGRASSRAAHDGLNEWIGLFAEACRRAVDDATAFKERIGRIQERWRAELGSVRANSAVDLLVQQLPGEPILSVAAAGELVGRSYEAANSAMSRLVEAGIVAPIGVSRRNRAFEAKAVIDAFAALERRLASPGGDTHGSPPSRSVPARRAR